MSNASGPRDRARAVVGRDLELRRIDAFAGALVEGVRALFLRGEPGIGKTALWNLGIDHGRAAGCRVLVTRPAEEEMALDLVALVDLFEEAGLDVLALRTQEDPFARGRVVLDAIRRLAELAPVVVAIDDVQWLDPVSARALRFALRRLDAEPVGIVATVRAGTERDDPLGCATTLPPGRVETIDLGPLGLEDLRRVLADSVTAITRPALRRIHEVSGGNPLYAIELARGLPADGRVGRSARTLSLPDSIGAAITRRLEGVPVELTPLLETVAALGPTTADELERSLPSADVDELLALAERDGILVVDGRGVRFAHPLFGEAVYGSMPPLARRSLHARLAEGATDPDVRARHLALSTDEPDAGVAALLEEAAHRASRRGAFDLAAEFARHGLRLTPADDADGARRRAHAEIENVAAAGEVSRALELADRQVERLPAGPGRAEALVLRSDLEDDDDPAMILSLLMSALEDAGDDQHLRARVLDELAFAHWLSFGDLEEGIARAREALAIAERLDDVTLRALTLAGLAHLEAIGGNPRPDDMQRAIALEDEAGQLRLTTGRRGRVLLAKQLRWAGDLRAARALIEATGPTDEFQRPFQMYDLALLECAAGDFARADELVDRGLEAVRDSGSSLGDRWFLYPKSLVDVWLGRAAEARSTAGRLLERAERFGERLDTVGARRVLGLLALSEGDPAAAVEDLTTAAQLLLDMGVGHPGIYPALPDAIEAHALAGDLASAVALLERLVPQAEAIDGVWATAVLARSRGVVLLAQGDADGAVSLLGDAAGRFAEIDHRPDAARAKLWQGRALLRGGRRSLAADVLTDAVARFAGLGAILWEARATEELGRAAPGRGSGRLTSTEARIAQLVSEGSRNREIASALFVSVATVEAHLTRIYRKLDIGSRSELSRLVAEGSVLVVGDEGPGAR